MPTCSLPACWAIATAALLGGAGTTNLLTLDTLRWVLILGPAMFAGIWIGRLSFGTADPAGYRRFVLNLLIVISALTVARAGWKLAVG